VQERSVLKSRLDQILVSKNLCESRSQAKALILAGKVLVNEVVIDKAGTLINPEDDIRLKESPKFVSRGGLKLEKALQEFKLEVKDKICLDIGASTGGFTDCLLQNGAKKVYAVDVGYGQMHWKLQQDKRVIRFDRENFRHFDLSKIKDPIDIIVMDVSFISAKKLIPNVVKLFSRSHAPRGNALQKRTMITLIKPQFEAGPGLVGKGGIVRDEKVKIQIVEDMKVFFTEQGFKDISVTESPIKGADGNVEYLITGTFSITPHQFKRTPS